MPEAYGQATQVVTGSEVTALEAAARLGVAVMTSASILQGRLSRGLPAELRAALPGLSSDALRAIQFARSAPGVTTALVGMGRPQHVRENAGILAVEPLSHETIESLFRSVG
jgi:aryl-alcohol dehydrogenase-like predicted oxidoreductase